METVPNIEVNLGGVDYQFTGRWRVLLEGKGGIPAEAIFSDGNGTEIGVHPGRYPEFGWMQPVFPEDSAGPELSGGRAISKGRRRRTGKEVRTGKDHRR